MGVLALLGQLQAANSKDESYRWAELNKSPPKEYLGFAGGLAFPPVNVGKVSTASLVAVPRRQELTSSVVWCVRCAVGCAACQRQQGVFAALPSRK